MSFNPNTGLVYMPVQGVPLTLMDNKNWTMGGNTPGEPHGGLGWNLAVYANTEPPKSKPFGRLIAWDPVRQKEVWRHEHVSPWNGGTLTTAGNLVFQGTADGRFVAYNATTGAKLWETATGTGVVAGPSTYLVDGKQYVSVAVGWGGVYGVMHRATDRQGPGTVYTFALGGTASRAKPSRSLRCRWAASWRTAAAGSLAAPASSSGTRFLQAPSSASGSTRAASARTTDAEGFGFIQ